AGTSAEFPPLQCILTGTWVNDLGSNMTIKTVDLNGDFTGIYRTAASATTKKIKESPLLGTQ
ncbi:AVID protein, partial [Orthonyx spaldingii]|nr:AVID protein [Orthonyx spaldingii]